MGPTNVAAAAVPLKDLSWFGRVCLKIENICAEVDKNPSILLQETSKYVESQVKEVGVNVKKLCNELMQDLLPPPIVTSEVAEKMPECAVHCKCNCMDFEKPKQKNANMSMELTNTEAGCKDVQAKGSEGRKKSYEDSAFEKQNIPTGVDMQFDLGNEEVVIEKLELSKFEEKKQKCTREEPKQYAVYDETGHDVKGRPKHVSGHEEAEYEVKDCTSPVPKEASGNPEEQLQESGEEQKNHVMEVEAFTKRKEDEGTGQEEITPVTVRQSGCKEAAVSASVNKEDEREELVRDGAELAVGMTKIVAETNGMVINTTGLDVKGQQQAAEISASRRPLMSSKGSYASDANTKEPLDVNMKEQSPSFQMMDATCARLLGGSLFSTEVKDAVGVEQSQKVGVDLRFMYNYVFSENSRSFKEDPMILSEYLVEEEAEQSARWLVTEDLRSIIHSGVFSAEKTRQAENCSKELDSDWELV